MEQLGNITKWLPHYRPRTPDMVVNIEWPGFQVISVALCRHQHTCDTQPCQIAHLIPLRVPGMRHASVSRHLCFSCSLCQAPLEYVTEVGPSLQATELPMLDEDRQLDAESTNAGEQQFEKLTAGLYMGDIARRIILRCCLLILSMLVT